MSALDDLRTLRDALDNVSHGALPSWYEPTTLLGGDVFRSAQSIVKQLHKAWSDEAAWKDDKTRLEGWLDDARAHADVLTRRTQALESEVERLRGLLARK